MNRPQLPMAGSLKQCLFDYKPGSKKNIVWRISLWLTTMSASRFRQLFKTALNQQRIYTSCCVYLSWRWLWSWCIWYWPKWKSIWVRNNSAVCRISVWGFKWVSAYFESQRKRNRGKRRYGWIWTCCFHWWILSTRKVFENRSRSTRYHKFSILHGDVLCTLEEVFEIFPDISDHLTLDKETFIALQIRAGAL